MGIRGDANGDGNDANIMDLTYLVEYLYRNGPPPKCVKEADVDCSGGKYPVNKEDLDYLRIYIFVQGPTPCQCNRLFLHFNVDIALNFTKFVKCQNTKN